MRLKAGIWVDAYLRRCAADGLSVYLERRGDASAGSIYIKVDYLDGRIMVYAPAMGAAFRDDGERLWRRLTGTDPVDEEQAAQAIGRQVSFDPDVWVIVVENRTGAPLLDQSTITEL